MCSHTEARLSTSSTRAPRAARRRAVWSPARPAPITAVSYIAEYFIMQSTCGSRLRLHAPIRLSVVRGEDQRRVRSAEPERVRHHVIHPLPAGFVRHVVEIALRVRHL